MKISLLLAAIIIAGAAVFGFQQKTQITELTTEWTELQRTAEIKGVTTDPNKSFDPRRTRTTNNPAQREKAVRAFANELIDFAARMSAAEKNGNGEDHELKKEAIGYFDIITKLRPGEFKILAEIFQEDETLDRQSKENIIMMTVMVLSQDHPEAALSMITETGETMGENPRGDFMIPMILSQYASKDPSAAAGWILENEDTLGDSAKQIKQSVMMATAQKDIASALTMIDTLGFEKPGTVIASLGQTVSVGKENDYLKAINRYELSESERKQAIRGIANSPLMKDFDKATAWLDSPELAKGDRAEIIESLSYHGTNQNPEPWLDWLAENPDSSSKASSNIISQWTQNDYVEAGQWLQKQEPGAIKNNAVETYAKTLAPHEPAAAAIWAETLPAGNERTGLLQTIHKWLEGKDPTAAAALAEKHQLSE